MTHTNLIIAEQFANDWKDATANGRTAPAFGEALGSCLDSDRAIDEAVRIFEIQFEQTKPAHVDDLSSATATSGGLARIQFLLFYGRLLWTHQQWLNHFQRAVASAAIPGEREIR